MPLPSNSHSMIFMRLSIVRAGVLSTVAGLALAACAGQNAAVPPSESSNGVAPFVNGAVAPGVNGDVTPGVVGDVTPGVIDDVTTCATSPPQYLWIFKGACDAKITVKPTGGTFKLGTYDDITVSGSIGENNVKGSAIVALADATDTNGDVEKYKGSAFPPYRGRGKTFVYASAVNQSSQIIKPIAKKNVPILKYVITDSKGIPGKTCGAAILTQGSKGSTLWESIPASISVKGKTVTIVQYNVPKGFEFPPKSPLYFAVNCFS